MARVFKYVFLVDGQYGSKWCLLMTQSEYEQLEADDQLQWISEVIALDNGDSTYTIISN